MEERLRGCKLTATSARFSGLQASAADGTERERKRNRAEPFDWFKDGLTGGERFHTVSRVSAVRNLHRFSPFALQREGSSKQLQAPEKVSF